MSIQLTKAQYKSTMVSGMVDVTKSAEPVVDIWPFVQQLGSMGIVHPLVIEKELVEKVYRARDKAYDHVLLPTSDVNTFIVIVVNLQKEEISGYYCLNLKNEYF